MNEPMTDEERAEMVARWFKDKVRCPGCRSLFDSNRSLGSHKRHCHALLVAR